MAAPEANAGLIGEVGLEGQMDFSSSATSAATGGQIKNGAIFNTSGGGLGLVKTLAYAGIGFLIWRLLIRS